VDTIQGYRIIMLRMRAPDIHPYASKLTEWTLSAIRNNYLFFRRSGHNGLGAPCGCGRFSSSQVS
jgi:hypothetical protein